MQTCTSVSTAMKKGKKIRLMPSEQIIWEALKALNDKGIEEPSLKQLQQEVKESEGIEMSLEWCFKHLKGIRAKGKARRTLEALA